METIKPKMMSVREIAETGLLSEHAIRCFIKEGKIPVLYIGKKALINYSNLVEYLSSLKVK